MNSTYVVTLYQAFRVAKDLETLANQAFQEAASLVSFTPSDREWDSSEALEDLQAECFGRADRIRQLIGDAQQFLTIKGTIREALSQRNAELGISESLSQIQSNREIIRGMENLLDSNRSARYRPDTQTSFHASRQSAISFEEASQIRNTIEEYKDLNKSIRWRVDVLNNREMVSIHLPEKLAEFFTLN